MQSTQSTHPANAASGAYCHHPKQCLAIHLLAPQVVALVGPSGGGKSSIVKLLERFYLPSSGRILIDGRDIGEYDHKWLCRNVALVSQEPVLYARSIKRNIIYGLEKEDGAEAPPSDEAIERAARLANAHDFIAAFPDGYETNCGEKGVAMSGGQVRVALPLRACGEVPAWHDPRQSHVWASHGC